MLIHSFDQGRRTGYALGPAGHAPVRRDSIVLRESNEDWGEGFAELSQRLDRLWQRTTPDCVIFEEPQSIAQWFQNNKTKKFPTDPDGVTHGLQLTSIIWSIAKRYGIEHIVQVRRQTIFVHILGKGNGRLNREEGKKAIICFCIENGYVEPGCKDDDMCDAIAMHIYASDTVAKVGRSDFRLFPTTAKTR